MKLKPNETELVGGWQQTAGRTLEDETSKRIGILVGEYLKPIATSTNGWEKLFQDPVDQRFWELTYPFSEMHGGGPPSLRLISEERACAKYGI